MPALSTYHRQYVTLPLVSSNSLPKHQPLPLNSKYFNIEMKFGRRALSGDTVLLNIKYNIKKGVLGKNHKLAPPSTLYLRCPPTEWFLSKVHLPHGRYWSRFSQLCSPTRREEVSNIEVLLKEIPMRC